MLVMAGIFAGAGVVMITLLTFCWVCFWWARRRGREVEEVISSLQSSEQRLPLYVRLEECFERQEAWHWRYHWCLLLTPLCFSLAAFCGVFLLTEDLHPWIRVPLAVASAVGTLLGCGYLGYKVVREKILRLDDTVVMEEE